MHKHSYLFVCLFFWGGHSTSAKRRKRRRVDWWVTRQEHMCNLQIDACQISIHFGVLMNEKRGGGEGWRVLRNRGLFFKIRVKMAVLEQLLSVFKLRESPLKVRPGN